MSTPADMQLVISLATRPGSSGYKMHNAGYQALGLNYLYLPRRYDGDIGQALTAARVLGLRGVSLTMPYKQSCLTYLDALSAEATAIGAVNTVVQEDGRLTGYNTDAPAAQKLITEILPWRDHAWIIFGAGGIAHAFAYVAQQLGVRASICARNATQAQQLAQRFQLTTTAWDEKKPLGDVLLFNATPAGMPGSSATAFYSQTMVAQCAGVFDAVANPATTPLIAMARANGLPAVSGDQLAFEQACLQFELYTNHPAPRAAMHEAMYR